MKTFLRKQSLILSKSALGARVGHGKMLSSSSREVERFDMVCDLGVCTALGNIPATEPTLANAVTVYFF